LKLREEGAAIVAAIEQTLQLGFRTKDLAAPGEQLTGTRAFSEQVAAVIARSEDRALHQARKP
jgi:hypothetical protein